MAAQDFHQLPRAGANAPRYDASSVSAMSTMTNFAQVTSSLKALETQFERQVEMADEQKLKFCKETIIKLHQKQQQEDGNI